MINTIIVLMMSVFAITKVNIQAQPLEGEVYIYDVSPKIYGQSTIGFIFINESEAVNIDFMVYFSKRGIISITKGGYPIGRRYIYSKRKNGDVNVDVLKLVGYSSENYVNHKLNNDDFYKMLNPDFFNLSNKQKYDVIQNLSELHKK